MPVDVASGTASVSSAWTRPSSVAEERTAEARAVLKRIVALYGGKREQRPNGKQSQQPSFEEKKKKREGMPTKADNDTARKQHSTRKERKLGGEEEMPGDIKLKLMRDSQRWPLPLESCSFWLSSPDWVSRGSVKFDRSAAPSLFLPSPPSFLCCC
jgi:hypothetical protein